MANSKKVGPKICMELGTKGIRWFKKRLLIPWDHNKH